MAFGSLVRMLLEMLCNFQFTALSERLPPNINLLTLRKAEEDEFIIRLEHIYQTDEDMALPTSVDLVNDTFALICITNI